MNFKYIRILCLVRNTVYSLPKTSSLRPDSTVITNLDCAIFSLFGLNHFNSNLRLVTSLIWNVIPKLMVHSKL